MVKQKLNNFSALKPAQKYRRICFIIYAFLIIFIFIQLFLNPYYGIADNGDFPRISLNAGIDRPDGYWNLEKYDYHYWNYFLNNYIYTEPQQSHYKSSSEYLVEISKIINDLIIIRPGYYDIRSLGFILFLIYSFALFIIFHIYSKMTFHKWLYILPTLTFIFFADASILMYFNSFFSEATGFVSLLLFFSLAWLWIQHRDILPLKYKIGILLLEIISSFFVGASKQQFITWIAVAFLIFLWQLIELFRQYNNPKSIRHFIYYCLAILGLTSILIYPIKTFQKNLEGPAGYLTIVNIIQGEILNYANHPEEIMLATNFNKDIIPVIMKTVGIPAGIAVTTDENRIHIEQEKGKLYNYKTVMKMLIIEPHIIWDLCYNKSKDLFADASYGTKMFEYGDDSKSQKIGFRFFKTIKDNIIKHTKNIHFFIFSFTLLGSSFFYIYKIIRTRLFFNFTNWHLSLALNIFCATAYFTCMFGEAADIGQRKYLFMVNQMFYVIFFISIIHLCSYIYIKFLKNRSVG